MFRHRTPNKPSRHLVAIPALALLLLSLVSPPLSATPIQSDTRSEKTLIYPNTGPVIGFVVDEQGLPIVGATVTQHLGANSVDLPPASGRSEKTTDLAGRFEFPPLDYRIPTTYTAFRSGYIIARASPRRIALGQPIVMFDGMDIEGQVVHRDGRPFTGFSITKQWSSYRGYSLNEDGYHLLGFGKSDEDTADRFETQPDLDGHFQIPGCNSISDGTNIRFHLPGIFDEFYWFQANPEWQSKPNINNPYDTYQSFNSDNIVTIHEPLKFEIKVSDNNHRPVPLDFVANYWAEPSPDGLYLKDRGDVVQLDGNVATIQYFRLGLNHFYIFPKPESGLLPARVELNTENEPPAPLDVTLKKGCAVTGIVLDADSNQPIENVAIRYFPKNQFEFRDLNISVPYVVRTDAAGKFHIWLPPIPGTLLMVGEVIGYNTVSTISISQIPDALREHFSRDVDPETDKPTTVKPFQLKRTAVLQGTVFSPDGNPLANVNFMATHRFANDESTMIVGQTDDNGNFEIVGLFDHALKNYFLNYDSTGKDPNSQAVISAKQRQAGIKASKFRELGKGKNGEELIFFWHESQAMNTLVQVPIDELANHLDVHLEHAPAVVGRILDAVTHEPVPDVLVAFSVPLVPLQTTGRQFQALTYTREDGTFLLEHYNFNPKSPFHLEKKGYWPTEIAAPSELKEEENYFEIDSDIFIEKKPDYGKPNQVVDVSKLPDDEALSTLIAYIQNEKKDLPVLKYNDTSRGVRPVNSFLHYLSVEISSEVTQLAARHPDSPFELAVYARCLDEFKSPGFHTSAKWFDKAKTALLKHLDDEKIFTLFRKINRTYHPSTADLIVILNSNKIRKVRRWAVKMELDTNELFGALDQYTNSNHQFADKAFQKQLESARQIWKVALTEFAEPDPDYRGPPIAELARSKMLALAEILHPYKKNQERVKKIKDMIEELLLGN